MTNKKLIKSTGIIGSAISTSRVLGFFRDILFAKFFGTTIAAQAFVVAFRLPNMLRDLIGEGATDAAIVPVLSEYKHTKSNDEYWQAARSILSTLILILSIVTILGIVLAPLIVRIIAPGFLSDPDLFSLTVILTRLLFPYVFFLGLVAYSKGVLNSLHHFTAPALASVILNITLIVFLWTLRDILGIKCMVVGVMVGGILQVLLQIPPLVKNGFNFKGTFSVIHAVNKRIGKLLIPRMMGTAVYQLSIMIDTMLASFASIVGADAPAALYFSNRLVQLPLAVFGISLATAVLPKMSKEIAQKDKEMFKNTIAFSLRTVFSVMLPATIGLLILSRPIVRILFQRGEFTAYSTTITTMALFFYSFGLFAYAGIKILVSAYYSMGDTKTPVKSATISLFVNIVLNLILMFPLKIGGLAFATSIAATTNFMILYVILVKRVGDIGSKEIVSSFLRVLFSSLVMGIITFILYRNLLAGNFISGVTGFIRLITIILVSSIVYISSAYIFKVESVVKMFSFMRNKIKN